MYRAVVESNEVTSSLLPFPLSSLELFLHMLQKYGKADVVAGSLLTWAKDRKGAHGRLCMTLVLLVEFKRIPEDTFLAMYPTNSDIRTALMTVFRTDRTFKVPGDVEVQYVPSEDDMPWVLFDSYGFPWVLPIAGEYFGLRGLKATCAGDTGPRGLTLFMNSILLPNLSGGETNYEHVLLAVKMLPSISTSLGNSGESRELLDKQKMRRLVVSAKVFATGSSGRPEDGWLARRCARALDNLSLLLFSVPSSPMLAATNKPFPGDAVFRRADVTNS